MIKAIFWDNDGVLVDTERLYFRATRQVLATVGIPLTHEQYIEAFLVRSNGLSRLGAEAGLPPEMVEQLRRERNSLYSALLSQESLLLPGVEDVLSALHPSYKMAVVTSSRPDHFALIHERTGILPHFEFILAAGDYTHSKPHPEPYLRAVERSGCRKDECLVIEDSERGLAAATAAGLRCIIVPSDLTRGSRFAGASQVLENLSELLVVLAQSSGGVSSRP